jgi:hypothetical protein
VWRVSGGGEERRGGEGRCGSGREEEYQGSWQSASVMSLVDRIHTQKVTGTS